MNQQFPGGVGPFEPGEARGFQQGQAGTFPGLPPKFAVPAVWHGPKAPLLWGPGTDDTVIRTTRWLSPIFDLRPDLRGGTGARANQRAIPIWRPMGVGGKMFLKVGGLNTQTYALNGLRVLGVESVDANAEQDITTYGDPQDLTIAFQPGVPTAVIEYVPLGSGYPIRYWQVTVTFDFLEDNSAVGPDPGFWAMASFY